MAKGTPSEIMGVLRQFEIAGEVSSYKSITHVRELSLRPGGRVLAFIFERTPYYISYNAVADDDTVYLLEELQLDRPGLKGRFIRNPHDDAATTYGLRYKFKEIYLFQVAPEKSRLDVEVTRRYPELTRSTIQKYIKAGFVRVNGEVIEKTKHEVTEHDDIAVAPPEKTDFSSSELPIIYIDDNVIVVNKPAGVLTHSKGALNDEFTVADFFRRYTTNALDSTRPGIVHRLDRDTSGVIIGARNDETATMLKKQFAERTTKKHYTAVVDGVPKLAEAIIDLPIGRNPSSPSMFRVDPSGKEALTQYKVIESNSKQSLLELHPKTGRTHQLRVHTAYINAPIAGDRVYGSVKTAPRLMLHATTLEITIPISSRRTFEAPLPKEFTEQFNGAGRD
ncbi:MAG: RluA family pseudouridine synthase [Candidatus Microsaccharimonas sp.]